MVDPLVNRTIDFVFTSFARFVMGRFLRTVIPCLPGCLDTLAWVREPDASFVAFPWWVWIFRAYLCQLPGGEFTFRSGALHVCDGREVKGLNSHIKYHGARMILRDMPSWVDRCDGFREYLEGTVLVPVPLHRPFG